GPADQRVTENRGCEIRIMEKAESPEHGNFAADVPVDFRVQRVAVEPERTRGKVVVAQPPWYVWLGPKAYEFMCDLSAGSIEQALGNDVSAARIRCGIAWR